MKLLNLIFCRKKRPPVALPKSNEIKPHINLKPYVVFTMRKLYTSLFKMYNSVVVSVSYWNILWEYRFASEGTPGGFP